MEYISICLSNLSMICYSTCKISDLVHILDRKQPGLKDEAGSLAIAIDLKRS